MKKVSPQSKLLGRGRGAGIYGGLFAGSLVGIFSLVYFTTPSFQPLSYTSLKAENSPADNTVKEPPVTHLLTPEPLKAAYMSSWVAGTPYLRTNLVSLIDGTELNAIVIDIKDYTGRIAFEVSDPDLKKIGSAENRISDIKEFIRELHSKNIYVIGRVAVFQDPYLVKTRPDLAVKKKNGEVWKDYKGISWLDAHSKEVWDYSIDIAEESYALGFDEINFDYIRFPSDGNMNDIDYPLSVSRIKSEVIRDFFEYLSANLRPKGIKISADLFGMTTTNTDDLNIGQILENALPYFDYIAPMVYPSHYPKDFIGLTNPNSDPYKVVHYSLTEAVKRAEATTTPISLLSGATSSARFKSKEPYSRLKIRPWLQDFDYGGNYDIAEVKAQIRAVHDAGLTSFMLWSPSNKYTRGALESE